MAVSCSSIGFQHNVLIIILILLISQITFFMSIRICDLTLIQTGDLAYPSNILIPFH